MNDYGFQSRSPLSGHVPMAPGGRPFSDRALRAIEGKEPLDQLALLQEYVEQAVRDKQDGYGPPEDDLNIVRRRYIRIASELYRGTPAL